MALPATVQFAILGGIILVGFIIAKHTHVDAKLRALPTWLQFIVGGVAGGLLLGPLPVGYDRSLKFGSVLYGSLGATVVGTLGFHAVRFGYILVTQWSGYPIVQVRSTGVYIVTLSRSGLVFYVVVEMGRYAFAVVLTALVASTLGYAIGDVVKRRYGTRPADRIGGE
jgi:hypothetical protein